MTFIVVVYWCLASAPVDTFDPHTLGAVAKFVAANPATCNADPPQEITGPKDLQECNSQAFLRYQPGWLQQHPSGRFLAARCFERKAEYLDLEAMKRRVRP